MPMHTTRSNPALKDYRIRTMSRPELDIAIQWAAEEGWNPGYHDGDCFYGTDPTGFLMGFIGDEPVASLSVVKYSRKFGFLGFFIVKKDFRGKGYGLAVWQEGMKYLQGCNVGLDGVVAQQDNYRKSGFSLVHRNIRYEGQGLGLTHEQPGIVDLNGISFQELAGFDKRFFLEDRDYFLENWIRQPGSRSLGILRNGRLAGYGVIRACRTGYKIGPLFAEHDEDAESLFVALTSRIATDQPVYLDIPAVNESALELVNRHNMQPVFETARMYTRGDPGLPLRQIYGISSFELG